MRRGGIERVRARARAPVNVARRTIGLFPPGSSFFFRGRRSLLALKGNLKSSPPPLALTARRSHARIPPRSPGLMLQYDPHCDARGSPLASRAGGTDRKGRGEGGGARKRKSKKREGGESLVLKFWRDREQRHAPSVRLRSPIPPAGWQKEDVARRAVGGKGSGECSKHQRRSERRRRSRAKRSQKEQEQAAPLFCFLALSTSLATKKSFHWRPPRALAPPRASDGPGRRRGAPA